MSAFKELIRRVKSEVREVSVEEASALPPGAALLDVREGEEWAQGHLPGAVHIPRGFLELKVEEALKDKTQPVLVYCAGGTRSALAARTLADLGYRDVVSLAGGFGRWKESGRKVVVPRSLQGDQKERYSRHVKVPEVGEAGQLKLLDSKALIVGAGGLGSPAAFYLAAGGGGTIGLVDFDRVDRSNLQRQILHTEASVGQPKTESAEARLRALNPDVKVVRHDVRLEAGNAQEVLSPYDVILDGCDNFSTKYLVNDAAVLLGKPNVYGSIYRFEGQMSSFVPGQGPCYRCLYPEPTPSELAPSCDEAGVLGVLPGVVGLVQATEAVKLLLGIGEPLVGRLLTYDALSMKFREFKVRKDPACALCGEKPTIRHLEDLVWACHLGARPAEVGA
jgi:molybdopterin/thiamine biosynthesis adenylyltransferase/rhodanese-related sulfurtransferase